MKLPEWAGFVWGVFIDISYSRDWADGKARPIKPSEIEAHCSLSKIELDPIEYALLRDLDREFVLNG